MNAYEKEARALEQAIANRIREKRIRLHWTLEDLANSTGLSKGHLSQIENAEKVPPISTLTKIAFGLGIPVMELITGVSNEQHSSKITIGRKNNRTKITHLEASPSSTYESFGFDKLDRIMDAFLVTMSKEFPPNPVMHDGQEFVLALSGIHEFVYDGQPYRLVAGDAIYYDSDRPHMGRSLSEEPAEILVVYCKSKREYEDQT
jgi:transcriptional regulator with XRE-family HTH domain